VGQGDNGVAADLNYNEARTALELTLAELQSANLDVETMAGLYQRAQGYANRCQTVLDAVEQQVMLWDSSDPKAKPEPYQP
jgi:exodeoxyribonuclease VII small subunit